MASGKLFKNEDRLLEQAKRIHSQGKKIPGINRRKNALVFFGLLSSVIGIYAYSMYSIKMDKFDFDD